MARLQGKVAIVTGGARGMGEATVRLFIENGAKVVIGDVLDGPGEALARELGTNAAFVHMDVSKQADWDKAVVRAQAFGALNVLVNNAAILNPKAIKDMSEDDYMAVIRVNQLGTFLGIRSVLEPMKAAGKGSIINVSSIDGFQAKNGLAAYASSKWAVRGLTKAAAIELGPYNIRVNTVHPGGIFTDMGGRSEQNSDPRSMDGFYRSMPIPRVGLPHEVAYVTLFLATDEASYTTGAEFLADGGWAAGLRNDALPSS
ncbi:MAG: glucose 1-dehydrogenase [Proteobacteria bacterium]|nr:glucose 1-dehydrogenase [Pseudomonadota bacterium]HQR03188.1 glucose 1-dehydrogenase [Rhodocyclaceae bacterium]